MRRADRLTTCLGPRHMPLETERRRHVTVAIPILAVGGLVAVSAAGSARSRRSQISRMTEPSAGTVVNRRPVRHLRFRAPPTVTVGPEQTGRIFNSLAATELGRRQIRMAVATSWCLARATVCLGRAVTSLEQQLRDTVAIRWSLPCCWESRSR